MFAGLYINISEDCAVLHVALRNFNDFNIFESGVDQVSGVLNHKESRIANGKVRGKTIDAIVNTGIGGSNLGPVVLIEVLNS